MSNKVGYVLLGAIAAATLFLALFIGVLMGQKSEHRRFEASMVRKGYAYYHERTGKIHWKPAR